jgi:hypothetical protein
MNGTLGTSQSFVAISRGSVGEFCAYTLIDGSCALF